MKLLLDHCIDWRLSRFLPGHEVKTAQQMGWEQLKNGKLLSTASEFDCFVTVDRNIRSEQNLARLPVTVVVLIGSSNRLVDLLPLVVEMESALLSSKRGQLIEVRVDGVTVIC